MAAGQALKRRGILAAAGAVVAGIAAKQTAQPVLAAGLTLEMPNTVNSGTTTIQVAPTFQNTVFEVDATASTANVLLIDAIRGRGQFTGAGVHGYGGDAKASTNAGLGVQGTGGNGGTQSGGIVRDGGRGVYAYGGSGGVGGDGVYAHGGGAGTAGLRGGYGVYAEAGSGAATSAVYAINRFQSSAGHVGVTGVCTSAGGTGVKGEIPSDSTAANTIGVLGSNLSQGANGIAVYGSCATGTGIYGQTSASNQYGILGATYATNSTAIAGACNGDGSSAFSGGTTNPNAYAGVFQGNVVIQGRLVVSDPSYKSGALAHPDGSHRLVYCVESPESWIEDVGAGTLSGGKASVTFDKDFAAVVHTDTYHVFLTSYDPTCNGLAVATRIAAGFTVQEHNGGTSTGTFSWKVMVKAKSAVKSERLGKFTMPNIPLPDVSKIKAPALPRATTEPKTP